MQASPALTLDDIDDVLYFVRVNEKQDLQQTIIELSQKHQCSAKDVLEAAVDPESGNTVLHYCAANGLSELLPSLLNHLQASPGSMSANGKTPIPFLINRANKEGNTSLHWGAYNGHLEIVKQLVASGADMWAKNAAGHLAMFEAERADKGEVVQFLLEAGGKEVERAGVEGQAEAADEVDVNDAPNGSGGVAVDTQDTEMR